MNVYPNLESLTRNNDWFRKIIFTSPGGGNPIQVSLMSLMPGQEIGWESHPSTQFFRVEEGEGTVVIDGTARKYGEGSFWVVPSGEEHNVISDTNTKLYTIYSPPAHPPDDDLRYQTTER